MGNRVIYNKKMKFVGLGYTPWPRFGLQFWFDNYVIVAQTAVDADFGDLLVYIMPDNVKKSGNPKEVIRVLLNSDWFKGLKIAKFSGFRLLTYRAPDLKDKDEFIANDRAVTERFENKADFRSDFKEEFPFIDFEIIRLKNEKKTSIYKKYQNKYGNFFMQDESLSGGIGTFSIKNMDDFEEAWKFLSVRDNRTVVSKLFVGQDYSLQCCVTKYGVFVGPLQRQLIGDKNLSNPKLKGTEKFCGVQVGVEDVYEGCYAQISSVARKVGQKLLKAGIRGIYSIDILVNEKKKEFKLLEVNPRITGVSPLYSLVQQDGALPLPMLHVLEVGKTDYSISDFKPQDLEVAVPLCSLMIIRNKSNSTIEIKSSLKSGHYSRDSTKMIDKKLNLIKGQVTVHSHASKGAKIGAGGKIAALYVHDGILGQDGELKDEYKRLAAKIYELSGL